MSAPVPAPMPGGMMMVPQFCGSGCAAAGMAIMAARSMAGMRLQKSIAGYGRKFLWPARVMVMRADENLVMRKY
jgi:hypothetical protein